MAPNARKSEHERERKVALPPHAQDAIPGLSLDVVVTHIIGRSQFLPNPNDLARLRAVSHSMRDAVARTGRSVKRPSVRDLVRFGDVRTLNSRLVREGRGRVTRLLGPKQLRRLCSLAAEHGHLEVLKWARENGCPWKKCTCMSAAKGGHLEVLKWARANGCRWDKSTCTYAALRGHLEVLRWARENDCPWGESTCRSAARNGHLEVLKWLHENGCPWSWQTCFFAAQNGHLEVLKWARENGCPWNEKTRAAAAARGYVEHPDDA